MARSTSRDARGCIKPYSHSSVGDKVDEVVQKVVGVVPVGDIVGRRVLAVGQGLV
jgi:hypothetical protein